jgi:2'-5' RNA ligase
MARDRAARPEARPLRLFVAFDVPTDVLGDLAVAVAPFRDRIPGARWTRTDGWHVTLKFLGATWPRLLDWVHATVADVGAASSPIVSHLTEVGAFPSIRRARVLWAGLADPEGALAALVARLDEALAAHFVAEQRSYSPHLTLARLNPPRDIREFAPELPSVPVRSDPFAVDRIVVYRSHLSPRGATYEPIASTRIGVAASPP